MNFLRFSILYTLLFFVSCDDGDIVVSEFEFETEDMDFCFSEKSDDTVFYNINNDEVIYLRIDDEFDGLEEVDQEEFDVNSTGEVQYIKFNDEIDGDAFFCNAVASVVSTERELTGTGGSIVISTSIVVDDDEEEDTNEFDGDSDNDGDGLNNTSEEFDIENNDSLDTDGDNIPDYQDEDDDNDGIDTLDELYPKDEDGEDIIETDSNGDTIYLDTDDDGTPNYLDEDDDNDGVITRFEGSEDNNNPANNANDDGLLNYLNPEVADSFPQVTVINNNFTVYYYTIVTINNLELENSNGESITRDFFALGEEIKEEDTFFEVTVNIDDTITVIDEEGEIIFGEEEIP